MHPFTFALAVLLAGTITPPIVAQTLHENEAVGYRLKLPKHFEAGQAGSFFFSAMPDDSFCVDRFQRKIGIPTSNLFDYDLYLATYFFPTATEAPTSAEKDAWPGEKGAVEKAAKVLRVDQRFEHFSDWAKERIQGFFFSDEKAKKTAGLEAVQYEMTFEKLTSVPEKWLACAYQVPGGEFAVLCNCTEEQFDKWRPTFLQTFASFKVLRESGLVLPKRDSEIKVLDNTGRGSIEADEGLTAEERREKMIEQREKRFAEEIAKLEKGWRTSRSDHYLILSEIDARYTKTVERHAEAMRAWLEEQFDGLGDGFVQDAIIRLRERPPSNGTRITIILGGGSIDDFEFWKPTSSFGLAEFTSLNDDLVRHWFSQKNAELWNRLPHWLRYGLMEYVRDAELKGSKLQFRPDTFERVDLAQGLALQEQYERKREGQAVLLPLEDLFRLTTEEQRKQGSWRYQNEQNASVLRFLVEGPGKSWERTEGLLDRYLSALLHEIQGVEKRLEEERKAKEQTGEEKEGAATKTEAELLAEEDESYRKRRKEALDNVEKEILQAAYVRTFIGWDANDWKNFDKRWRSFAAQGQGR